MQPVVVSVIGYSDFGFVSDFEIGVSDFPKEISHGA
jgi:hypothetical protein